MRSLDLHQDLAFLMLLLCSLCVFIEVFPWFSDVTISILPPWIPARLTSIDFPSITLHSFEKSVTKSSIVEMQPKVLTSISLFSVLSLAQLKVEPGLVLPPSPIPSLLHLYPNFFKIAIKSKQRIQRRQSLHKSQPNPPGPSRSHNFRRPSICARRSIARSLSPHIPSRHRNHDPRLARHPPNLSNRRIHYRLRQARQSHR